jgi:hypothetical protein
MDYMHISIIGSLLGTVSIILIYVYLYAVYRDRYIGIWSKSRHHQLLLRHNAHRQIAFTHFSESG